MSSRVLAACVVALLGAARAESSGLTFGLADLPALEAVTRRAPGFAGIVLSVPVGDGACWQLGTVFPALAGQTLRAATGADVFPGVDLCPEVEVVPHSLRTLARVARDLHALFPALPVTVDTGLNRVLVPDAAVVNARAPQLAPYVLSERERPPYQLSLAVRDGVPVVRVHNPVNRRVAAQPFTCAPRVDVWQGAQRLGTPQPGIPAPVACALAAPPLLLRPGETVTLTGTPGVPLTTLPPGPYTLRVTTDDQPPRTAQLIWNR